MLVAFAVVAWTSRTKGWDDVIAAWAVTSLTIAGQSGCCNLHAGELKAGVQGWLGELR
jgi:hypothetical protein